MDKHYSNGPPKQQHDDADLMVDIIDIGLDLQQINMLKAIKRLINQGIGELMAFQEDIMTAVQQVGTDASEAANRVIATINENNAAIDAANAQIAADQEAIAALQAQIDAGVVTPEAAQAVVDSLAAVSETLDAIDTTPVAEVPVG